MDPFIGEIRMHGFNFAPRGWALCNGAIMPISQNAALFSLLGTFYGGNGSSTFALPNLMGRAVVHQGQGAGLSAYALGQSGGTPSVSLGLSQLAVHVHTLPLSTNEGTASSAPSASVVLGGLKAVGRGQSQLSWYVTGQMQAQSPTTMNSAAGSAGGSQPHDNMQPFLAVSYVIALQGIFPQRP